MKPQKTGTRNKMFALFLAGVGLCSGQQNFILHKALPFAWPSDLEEAAALKLSNDDVVKLLNNILGDQGEPAVYGVNEFQFAPLVKQQLYLVASADASGRDFFTELTFLYCNSALSCVVGSIPADSPHDFYQELVDIDGDGIDELVVKKLAGGYEGIQTIPVFTYAIYRIVSGKVIDVSDRYVSYYESTLLPRMKSDVTSVRASTQQPDRLEIVDALATMAQDDYQRRVLKRGTAGLDHAESWAHSGNPRLETFAVQSLFTINGQAADDLLSELTHSEHKTTAALATSKAKQKLQERTDQHQ
jgi:hypothetical protein